MAPAPKKDFGVILFDISSSIKDELLHSLLKFVAFKFYTNSKSLYELIIVNSKETRNHKNYPNIFTAYSPTVSNKLTPKLVYEIINKLESANGRWIDALELSLIRLKEMHETKGLITLQLIFFTSLETPCIFNDSKIQNILHDLNTFDIFLYIIGPDVTLCSSIINISDIDKCMESLQFDKSNANLTVAHKIVVKAKNGVMCNNKIGPHLLISFKKFPGSQPFKVPIAFGTKFSIPASTFKIFRKDLGLKLKSSAGIRKYKKGLAKDFSIEINEADVIKGVERHGRFIPVNDAQFKDETQRCFEILGFTESKCIPESHIFGEDCYLVMPDKSMHAFQIFTHLVNILHESNKYGIIKRVYAANTKPSYYILVPYVDYKPKCLIMSRLAYAGFMMSHNFQTPTIKEDLECDDFHKFFQSLIIDTNECRARIDLGPKMMLDVQQQKIINLSVKKAVENGELVMERVINIDYMTTLDNRFLESLQNIWPVRKSNSNANEDF